MLLSGGIFRRAFEPRRTFKQYFQPNATFRMFSHYVPVPGEWDGAMRTIFTLEMVGWMAMAAFVAVCFFLPA